MFLLPHRIISRLPIRLGLIAVALGLLGSAAPALAGGGNVLPASANPRGYSLTDIAAATAVYNTGHQVNNPNTPPPPDVPFEVLVDDAKLKPGTMIYLPIFSWDNSGPATPGFPADITNQPADAAFLIHQVQVFTGAPITAFLVQVDGKDTVLGNEYITGTTTPPLLDGTPPGTKYIISAAFLTPLTPGHHTVGLGGLINGNPVVFVSYDVTVR